MTEDCAGRKETGNTTLASSVKNKARRLAGLDELGLGRRTRRWRQGLRGRLGGWQRGWSDDGRQLAVCDNLMLGLINVGEIQRETQDEKRDGRLDGGATEDIARFRTKGGFHSTAAHGGNAGVRLGLLHENEQDQNDGNTAQYQSENSD